MSTLTDVEIDACTSPIEAHASSKKGHSPLAENATTVLGLSVDTRTILHNLDLLRPATESGVLGVRKASYGNSYFVRHSKRGHVGSFPTKQHAAEAMIDLTRELQVHESIGVDDTQKPDHRPDMWEQHLRSCALNPDLRHYLLKHSVSGDTILPKVRKYFVEHEPSTLDILFGDTPWQVDHIIPRHIAGGAGDIVDNLVLMEEHANKHFGAHVTKLDEKRAYVGERVFKYAENCVHHEQKRPRLT